MSRVLREPRELFAEKVPQNRPHASFTKTCKVQQKTAKLVSLKHWLFLLSVSLTSFSSFCYRGVVGNCHCEAGAETSCHRALVARSCRNWTPHPSFGHPLPVGARENDDSTQIRLPQGAREKEGSLR